MPIMTITGNDTLTINGRVINDLALDDTVQISFPNDMITRRTGKNGNTIYAQNASGQNADLTLRVSRGSSDDQFFQSLITGAPADFPSTEFLNGTFVKRLGDGQGNVISDSYVLKGGIISRQPDGKENVSGDVMQGETVYNLKFASAYRNIG